MFYSDKVDFIAAFTDPDNNIDDEYQYKEDTYDDPNGPFAKAASTTDKSLSNTSLIGFYGFDNDSYGEKRNNKELPKPIVKITNKEKLVAEISLSPDAAGYADEGNHLKIELLDKDGNSLNTGKDTCIEDYKLTYPDSLTLYLDSLNANQDDDFSSIPNGTSEKKFEFSASGLGIGGDNYKGDVTLKVTVFDDEGKMQDETVTTTFNPLFANGSGTPESSTETTAYIEYGRHLQNLDKVNPATPPAKTKAVVRKTIDFSSTAGDYEGWADTYPGTSFKPLINFESNPIDISGPGVEIQYIDIAGDGLFTTTVDGFYAHDLIFRNPTVNGGNAGVLAGTISGAGGGKEGQNVEKVSIINPTVKGTDSAGGVAGTISGGAKIYRTEVYDDVGRDKDGNVINWSDPRNDPFSKYTITATGSAGGIAGTTESAEIELSTAAVKVGDENTNTAGGLVGSASSTTVTNSCVFGHTYKGAFDEKDDSGVMVDLRDNISGATAGGLFGNSVDGNVFKGTVYSTCSVSGTTVDTAYNGTQVNMEKIDPDYDVVYTLGTSYEGTEKTSQSNSQWQTDGVFPVYSVYDDYVYLENPGVVIERYDSSASAKYCKPSSSDPSEDKGYKVIFFDENGDGVNDFIMRGDWLQDSIVKNGFFYWEKWKTGDIKIHAMYYNSEEDDPEEKPLFNEIHPDVPDPKDGVPIVDYGYGAFEVYKDDNPDVKFYFGGSKFYISEILVELSDTDSEDKDIEETIEEKIKQQLVDGPEGAEGAEGVITEEERDFVHFKIYRGKEHDLIYFLYDPVPCEPYTVNAKIGGRLYVFAPDYYGLAGGSDIEKAVETGDAEFYDQLDTEWTDGWFGWDPTDPGASLPTHPLEVRTVLQLKHLKAGALVKPEGAEVADSDDWISYTRVDWIYDMPDLASFHTYAYNRLFLQTHDIVFEKDDVMDTIPVFDGTYDGQGYRIINAKFKPVEIDEALPVYRMDYLYSSLSHESKYEKVFNYKIFIEHKLGGMFGVAKFATLKNIVLYHPADTVDDFADLFTTDDTDFAGGIAALYRSKNPLENCVVSGYNINSKATVLDVDRVAAGAGGIVGLAFARELSVKNCHANITLGSSGNQAGLIGSIGITSEDYTGTIENCYAVIHDKGEDNPVTVAGIVGCASFWGDFWSTEVVLGTKPREEIFVSKEDIPEEEYQVTIQNCYAISENVSSDSYAIGNGLLDLIHVRDDCYGKNSSYKIKYYLYFNYENCYYVNSKDFAEGLATDHRGTGVTGVSLDELQALVGGDLGSEAAITYKGNYKNPVDSGYGYPYPAVSTTDGEAVHYGPWPGDTGVGDLIRGPLAGIFDVQMKSWGEIDSGQCAGLLSYNRSGLLCSFDGAEAYPDPALIGTKYVGVFFCKPSVFTGELKEYKTEMCIGYNTDNITINDTKLSVYADDVLIENSHLIPFNQYLNEQGVTDALKLGFYPFTYKGFDGGEYKDEFLQQQALTSGIDVDDTFNLYVLIDEDGHLIERKNVSNIRIDYIDENGRKGTLIYADITDHESEKFEAKLPNTESLGEAPKVIAFMASTAMNDVSKIHKEGYPYYVAPYVAYARLSGVENKDKAFGELTSILGSQSHIGIAVPKNFDGYLTSKDLIYTIGGVRAKLEVWGNKGDLGDIANLDSIFSNFGLNRSDYNVYYVTNLKSRTDSSAINTGWNVMTVQWGADQIMRYSYEDFKQGSDNSQEAIKAEKSFMPKIGIGPLYYSTNSWPEPGFIRAGWFAQYNDPTKKEFPDRPWYSKDNTTVDKTTTVKVSDRDFVLYIQGNWTNDPYPSIQDLQTKEQPNITVSLSGVTVNDENGDPMKDPANPAGGNLTECQLNPGGKIEFVADYNNNNNDNTLALKISVPDNVDLNDGSHIVVNYKQDPDVNAGEVSESGEIILDLPINTFEQGGNPKDLAPTVGIAGIYKALEKQESENDDYANYLHGFVFDRNDTSSDDHISKKGNLEGKNVEKLREFVIFGDSIAIDNDLITVKVTREIDGKEEPLTITPSLEIMTEKTFANANINADNWNADFQINGSTSLYELKINEEYNGEKIDTFEEDDTITVYFCGEKLISKKVSEFNTESLE